MHAKCQIVQYTANFMLLPDISRYWGDDYLQAFST